MTGLSPAERAALTSEMIVQCEAGDDHPTAIVLDHAIVRS